MEFNVHTLNSGTKIISMSKHAFALTDGSTLPAQQEEFVDRFNVERKFTEVSRINECVINKCTMELSKEQLSDLKEVSKAADIVILPFMLLAVLRDMGNREQFPNCVAYNATIETRRSPINEKVVDLNNFSH